MVSMAGLEPARETHTPLKRARIPIPPHRQAFNYSIVICLSDMSLRRMLTQGQPSRKMIFNHFPAAECHIDKLYNIKLSISKLFECRCAGCWLKVNPQLHSVPHTGSIFLTSLRSFALYRKMIFNHFPVAECHIDKLSTIQLLLPTTDSIVQSYYDQLLSSIIILFLTISILKLF